MNTTETDRHLNELVQLRDLISTSAHLYPTAITVPHDADLVPASRTVVLGLPVIRAKRWGLVFDVG
jgi:hypothetical protein